MINKLFCFIVFACCQMIAWSQEDTLKTFYRVNREIEIKDFEKYHFPLNGKEVKMIPYREDQLFGFVANDETREWLVPPRFKDIFTVYKEGAVVKGRYGYGLLSEKDEWRIPAEFDHLYKERELLYHGLFFYGLDTLLPEGYDIFIFNAYFDGSGKEIFSEKAHDQKSFTKTDSLAWFRFGTTFKIRGSSGKLWKQFSYQKDKEFIGIENNLLIYKEEQEVGFLYKAYDIYDQLVFTLPYKGYLSGVVQLSADLYLYNSDEFYGFCNGKGEFTDIAYRNDIYQFPWEDKGVLYEEYLPVRLERGHGMGLMDRKGKMILELEYDHVSKVIDDFIFCIPKGSSFGQVRDIKGKLVTDSIWLGENEDLLYSYELLLNSPIGFQEGLMVNKKEAFGRIDTLENGTYRYYASDKQEYFYINKNGEREITLDTSIMFAGVFKEGLAPVVVSGEGLGFINKKGEVVIDGAYEITTMGEGPIPMVIIPFFKGGYAYIKSHNLYIDTQGKEFLSYTDKYDMEGHWMEVRAEEIGIDIGIPMPSTELIFYKTGVARTKWYTSPNGRYISGHYELKDSLLIFNPEEEYKFDRYLKWDNFTIEKRSKDELIMRSNRRPSRRHYFLSKEKFDQFSPEEIRANYSYTKQDTLKLIELKKKKAALKELRKNDLSSPKFPGGYDALKKFMETNLVYPANHEAERLVRVNFEVDENGKISNIKARTNRDDDYKKEAERLVRSMPNWLPCRRDNIALKSKAKVSVRFKRKR